MKEKELQALHDAIWHEIYERQKGPRSSCEDTKLVDSAVQAIYSATDEASASCSPHAQEDEDV